MTRLPIDDILPDLMAALRNSGRAVLQAPPGAGKTTRVPLAMLQAGLSQNRIVMLEPRRLAARSAAERMAQTLGEDIGETVGYRMRGASKTSSATRIEVVTEGILTRWIQSDPGLEGVGAVIFDEFHERSLNADLGLALCLEIAGALREDLLLLAMSATLDAEPVATLMQAPILTSQGRSFPVTPHYLAKPTPKERRFEDAAAELILQALQETTGGVLVFLPGEGEIRRVQIRLSDRLPEDTRIFPLYGALPFSVQQDALKPLKQGRKLVLATAIAETSLTIPDIRVVVDTGRARRARFDPGSGMSRLVTEQVTRAEAAQRAGRAGRVAEGTAYRMWTKGQDGALTAYPPPEIEAADLSALALELALWGADAADLPFLTPPPAAPLAEARALLKMLGALDGQGRITDHGKDLAKLPLHPRLAHMLMHAGQDAAPLAGLLADRDPLHGAGTDLMVRLRALQNPKAHPRARTALDRINAEAKRLRRLVPGLPTDPMSTAEMAALAYPDRIAQRRVGDAPRFLLSGGKGAVMDAGDALAGISYLVATDLDGNPREARIRQAIATDEGTLRMLFADQIEELRVCAWSKRDKRVAARVQERLGALVLSDRKWSDTPPEQLARAMLDGVRDIGLDAAMTPAAKRFLTRVALAREAGHDLPDVQEDALMDSLEDWLLPHLVHVTTKDQWRRFDLLPALKSILDWAQSQTLDKTAPPHFTTPLGRTVPIDYTDGQPQIALRLQEMFGQSTHPMVGKTPLKITLLSPAQRPIQITTDLPGFWAGSYTDVRKDMRAQYPKHPWPEDPTQADPTLRAKRRSG